MLVVLIIIIMTIIATALFCASLLEMKIENKKLIARHPAFFDIHEIVP